MNRKVFIDCGAWWGNSTLYAKNNLPQGWEFIAFECGENNIDNLKKSIPFAEIHNSAVWINDGYIDFNMSSKNKGMSSSILNPKSIAHPAKVRVPCIDFSRWIGECFTPLDHIIVKMNIEGAEYEVLAKMLLDNTIDYVSKLFMQWHYKENIGVSNDTHRSIMHCVSKRTHVEKWELNEDDHNHITGNILI